MLLGCESPRPLVIRIGVFLLLPIGQYSRSPVGYLTAKSAGVCRGAGNAKVLCGKNADCAVEAFCRPPQPLTKTAMPMQKKPKVRRRMAIPPCACYDAARPKGSTPRLIRRALSPLRAKGFHVPEELVEEGGVPFAERRVCGLAVIGKCLLHLLNRQRRGDRRHPEL